jgi:hypothetical protein
LLLTWQSIPKVLSLLGVLYLWPPHSSSLDKGQKREGGTDARDALHCKDDDVMVDAVVMVKVLFCMFLRAGFREKF